MMILAVTTKDSEYLYDGRTAHKVSKRSCEAIRKVLNEYRYKLPDDNGLYQYTWYAYDVDQYDRAYDYAQFQDFTIRKGLVKERRR